MAHHKSGNGLRRLLITVAVMSATVMQVLDTTIVNVALPHMQGSLGANPDQISWVLTSYLVSSGIFMPLSGYFTDRFGQKRYLLFSIAGFVASSAFCGLSANLAEIVAFRLLQGVFGAALVPLSQSIMVQTYPLEERGCAMAIWGLGVMVGPILGPTLGGYLTEQWSWRWTFYINVPVGVFSFLLTALQVPDTERRERLMDWTGFLFIALCIASLQGILDRGNEDDWFNSDFIKLMAFSAAFGLIAFIYHSWRSQTRELFSPHIFSDRNFVTAAVLIAAFGLGLFGMLFLQPLMLESLLRYPVLTTGLVMAPRGIASMVSMLLVGRLIRHLDTRLIILCGILLSASGCYITTYYNLNISLLWVIGPIVLQGLGVGLIFVPLSTIAFATLPPRYAAEAAGLYSLLRTVGSSIGISIVSTIYTRHTQIAWNQIGGHINLANPALYEYLGRLQLSLQDPAAAAVLSRELQQQAQMVALLDCFILITWSFVIMSPLVLWMRPVNMRRSPS
jgi:DHA2 family multidrug resistance protein